MLFLYMLIILLLLTTGVYCEFITVVAINGIDIKEGYLGDKLSNAGEFMIEVKLKSISGTTYNIIELRPWTENGYRVESVTKSMEWISRSYAVSDQWPYSAEFTVTYNGMAHEYGTVRVSEVLGLDPEGVNRVVGIIRVKSESENGDIENFFDMHVSVECLGVHDMTVCDGTKIKTPSAFLLPNDGGLYTGCFDNGEGGCTNASITMTRARRIGTRYLPENAILDDYVRMAYKDDSFLYTQYARDTEANTAEFFPVIDGVADVLVSIKSIVNTRPDIPVTGNIALQIYEDYSLNSIVGPSLLYMRDITGDFFSLRPDDDIHVVSHMSIATREKLANHGDRAAIKISITNIDYPASTYSVNVPVSGITRYDTNGDESVIMLGIYEVRYTVIPIEAVYAIVSEQGKLGLTRKERATSIHGTRNNVTIPPTQEFSPSAQFTNTGSIGNISEGDSTQLPFYGFLAIAGGLVVIIVIIIISALCCCLKKRRNSTASVGEAMCTETAQEVTQGADNL